MIFARVLVLLALFFGADVNGLRLPPSPEAHNTQLTKNEALPWELRGAESCGYWNRSQVLGSDGKNKCQMKKMGPNALDGATPPDMCLRTYHDVVSDLFKAHGYWQDCPQLAQLWKELPDRSAEYQARDETCLSKSEQSKLYVDIGANIGTCLMQMASRSDVPHTLAFEPSQANLFYLTSTLRANPIVAQKCTLYAHALGSSNDEHKLFSQKGNAGNTVVDQRVGDPGVSSNSMTEIGTTSTRKLDDVLFMEHNRPPYIHLLKIDTQGFEVEILKGAKKLLASGAVNAVKTELAKKWLVAQKTTPREYLNFFLENGYDIRSIKDVKKNMTPKDMHELVCSNKNDGVGVEIVAVYQPAKELRHSPITC